MRFDHGCFVAFCETCETLQFNLIRTRFDHPFDLASVELEQSLDAFDRMRFDHECYQCILELKFEMSSRPRLIPSFDQACEQDV
jgi:hypothetical protein